MEFAKDNRTSKSKLAEERPFRCSDAYPLPDGAPITYFMFSDKMYTPDIGGYKTYSIAVYGYLSRLPLLVVRDVSINGDAVFRMVRAFNRHKLSSVHLMDAIKDMLG